MERRDVHPGDGKTGSAPPGKARKMVLFPVLVCRAAVTSVPDGVA